MRVNKLAGLCLITFGTVNVLHEIALRLSHTVRPGPGYAIVSAALFAIGAWLLWSSKKLKSS